MWGLGVWVWVWWLGVVVLVWCLGVVVLVWWLGVLAGWLAAALGWLLWVAGWVCPGVLSCCASVVWELFLLLCYGNVMGLTSLLSPNLVLVCSQRKLSLA